MGPFTMPVPSPHHHHRHRHAASILGALALLLLSASLPPQAQGLPTLCMQPVTAPPYTYNFTQMIPYPVSSTSVLLADMSGVIYSADVPPPGQEGLRNVMPFLDLSDRLSSWPGPNIRGLALHPDFPMKRRFFVSYICSVSKWDQCNQITKDGIGPPPDCACNLGGDLCSAQNGGTGGCDNVLVVDEFFIPEQGLVSNEISARMLAVALAFRDGVGGQILFRPGTSRMLIPMGDGGAAFAPLALSQNATSPFGKVLRIETDTFAPILSDIQNLGLIGEYAIPLFGNMGKVGVPGITFALGLKSPYGCQFDPTNTTGILCSDIGRLQGVTTQNEVFSILSGANYGWPQCPASSSWFSSPQCNTSLAAFGASGIPSQTSGGGHLLQPGLMGDSGDYCAYRWYLYNNGTDLSGSGSFYAVKENVTGTLGLQGPNTPVSLSCYSNATGGGCTPPSSIISWMANGTSTQYLVGNTGIYYLVDPALCGLSCAPPPAPPFLPNTPPGPTGGGDPGNGGGTPSDGSPPVNNPSPGGSPSGTPAPASNASTAAPASNSSSTSSGGSVPAAQSDPNSFLEASGIQGSFDSTYWIKLAAIFGVLTVVVCGTCSFFIVMGWREGKKKDQRFLELKQAEAELDERARDNNDDDMVYHPAGDPDDDDDNNTLFEEEEGTEYNEEMSEDDESMSQYSSRYGGTESQSGRSASTRSRRVGGDGESDAGTDYTGYTGYSGQTGQTGQTGYTGTSYATGTTRSGTEGPSVVSQSRRGDGMSDSQSYTTRDDWTDTASGYNG